MSNPTSNFGWQMPTPTDLVTDLPADFEVFGQAVDTSLADLKGGTTGQILSKATNTDMDFVWITNDQGDITAVNVTSPITGGGTSGAVTVGIQSASTTQSGAVQLSDSTSTTSSVLASTPTATKAAYDLANTANSTAGAAIPKSTVTTNGDLIYGTGSATVSRIGIGSTGQVLTVSGGVPTWANSASFIGCRIYKTGTNQSISNNTYTLITFNAELYDTNNFHSTSVSTERMTIPAGLAGYYTVTANVGFDTNTTGRRLLQIRKNGTAVSVGEVSSATATNYPAFSTSVTLYLAVGDYVDFEAYQTSGGNLDVLVQSERTSLQIERVGS